MTTQITESFQQYKGYTIRLRAVTMNGFWYAIIKEVPNNEGGIHKIYLRKKGWNFIEPEKLLQKAKTYIDDFPKELETKFDRLKTEYNNKKGLLGILVSNLPFVYLSS